MKAAAMMSLGVLALSASAVFAPAATAGDLCPVTPVIHTNGTVSLDGKLYSDPAKLKVRLFDYRKHNPNCAMNFHADPGTPFLFIGRVMVMLQQTGNLGKVGFLIEPRNTR
jgi:biopolymer transport protein ExbD